MQVDSTKAASDDLNTSTNAERAYDVGSFMVKATAGVLAPVGGGVLAAAFDLIVTDPAIRRRDKFLTDVNERLTEMEQSGVIRAKDLEDSEEISSLLLKAVQTATRSSGEQKLEALKEIVVKGITAKEAASASQAQVMLALVDRITEYHIIALNWRSAPRRQYSLGQIRDNIPEGARQSLHYGQPVFTDKQSLQEPVIVYQYGVSDFVLYVERASKTAFDVAEADLIALGLTKPIYQMEEYLEGRKRGKRQTNTIIGAEISELGKHLLRYVGLMQEEQKRIRHVVGTMPVK